MTGGRGRGAERHGIEAAGRLGVQQELVAEHIEQIKAHLLAFAGHARARKYLSLERIRIFVLELDAGEGVEELPAGLLDQVGRVGRPGAHDGLRARPGPAAGQ